MSKSENGNAVASSALLGRAIVWLLTLSLIGVGWFIFDGIEDKRWGRTIVGIINCTNGMAFMWMIQAWRRRPND